MLRCPKCGLDVSPALRVCGSCQTRLDGAAELSTTTKQAAAESRRNLPMLTAAAGGGFLLLWPIVALAVGVGGFWIFVVWFGAAIATGLTANSVKVARQPKTITVPSFGELTTTNWKKGGASYWIGTTTAAGEGAPVEVSLFCTDAGPSELQRSHFESIDGDLPHLKTLAINALRALDRSEWPESARDGTLELKAIELEDDEDTREGIFTLRFESPADPEAEYYVDFRNGAVEEAYRIG